MPNSSLQSKLNRIKEKKSLYEKRVVDARKKKRPDIEKIWLDEIKVLDEERDKLVAAEKKNGDKGKINLAAQSATVPSAGSKIPSAGSKPSAKDARKLRQLKNQIQYIKRKISIHTERGESAAVTKQTALLNTLLNEKEQLTKKNTSSTSTTVSASSAPSQPRAVASASAIPANQQNKINDLNADIAHADKMIAEYQRFKSPKAQHWIGRKFQLVAQRDALLKNNQPHTPPPIPAHPKPSATPSSNSRASAATSTASDAIAAAQATNKQVRVLDLEIAHANKMIREYQKYNSPKASQWIQRKNDLLARRARITGKAPQPTHSGNSQDPVVQRRIRVISIEIAHADKMITEYQKYHSPKANEWIERRNDLLAEKNQLAGGSVPISSSSTTDRATLKAQISDLNRKAKEADTNMRTALKQGNHQQANAFHQQRDDYNLQVKKITALLTGAAIPSAGGSSNTSTHTQPANDASNQRPKQPSNTGGQGTPQHVGSANVQEKSIAHKYLTTRNYSNEHAYMEVIDTLLTQSQYRHLVPAKETLYDITHPSKLPPAGTVINNPYIRDCFKIKVSGVRLEGYTINDTIFDTSFPRDFDAKIDRINQHVGPAPALKHYKYLAHRDAIQLIPSDRSISRYNSQFAGAKLHDIVIKNIKVRSQGALQGLFASDGSFENIHMENISVQTNSAHQIAILGLLSGTLDLSSPNGSPIHVNLLPLRLAGGNNIYINSFSRNSSYQYGRVNAGRSNAVIADNRQKMTKRGTYYQDFNMDDFFAAMRRSDPNIHILTRIKDAAKTAGTLAKVI